jgi:hypothetical protein
MVHNIQLALAMLEITHHAECLTENNESNKKNMNQTTKTAEKQENIQHNTEKT